MRQDHDNSKEMSAGSADIDAEQPVLRSDAPVTLLGAAPVAPGDLEAMRELAPRLVAADGGAAGALRDGHWPDAVIGDMDSFVPDDWPDFPRGRLHKVAEQDSTDFDKALRHVAAPLVLALGVTGGRVDHELAAYHTLIRAGGPPCVIVGAQDIVCHVPVAVTLDLPAGTRVSLFPLRAVTARLSGLRWSFGAIDLAPGARIGTSNAATGGRVEIAVDGPGTLLILPRAVLPALIAALTAGVPD